MLHQRRIWILPLTMLLLIFIGIVTIYAFTLPSEITVYMYRLNSDGSKYQPEEPCSSGNTNWGCTAFDKDHYPPEQRRPYPYATNPVTVSIESDYLLDVVPQEMNPGLFHPTALRAQAIAARSFAYWHIHQGSNINNSIQFQAFIPYKFESLNSGEQQAISDAIAPRYYVSYSDDFSRPNRVFQRS